MMWGTRASCPHSSLLLSFSSPVFLPTSRVGTFPASESDRLRQSIRDDADCALPRSHVLEVPSFLRIIFR